MQIKVLKKYTKAALNDINALLIEWAKRDYRLTEKHLKSLIKKSHLVVLYDLPAQSDKKTIVGTVTLIELHKLSGVKATIEHVLVSEKYRGRGFGKKLMHYTIALAKKLKIESLCLTCDPDRTIANTMYQSLGFIKEDTYFYSLDLKKKK